jgi:nucleoside-diphosphate-sugar epimerase
MRSGTALVTGFPGWLGSRLVRELIDDRRFDRVRCLVHPRVPTAEIRAAYPELELVAGDIRDPGATETLCAGAGGATAFHLAAIIHRWRVRRFYEVNTEGTRHLIRAARAAGVRRIVATSSNSPLGCSRDRTAVLDERAPYKPGTAYGRSKQMMEEDLRAAHRPGVLETVILRPCWFYGPGQPARQTLFFRMIRQGRVPVPGDGDAQRSLSYVDDLVAALLLAAVTERAGGQTYWVADPSPYSLNEIIDTVEDLMASEFGLNVARSRLRVPSLVSELALTTDVVLQRAGIHLQKVHVLGQLNKTIACSVAKARHDLGFIPAMGLREGMRRSIAWCLAAGEDL